MKITRKKSKVIAKQLPTTSGIICGTENPVSLHCRFYELESGEVATMFTPEEIHEGHRGIMHGGISGAVLDELMGRATLHSNIYKDKDWVTSSVTAEMTVKYKKPILVGQKMYGFGRIDRAEGRCFYNSAEILDENGEVMSTATGVYVQVELPRDKDPEYRHTSKDREALRPDDPKEL